MKIGPVDTRNSPHAALSTLPLDSVTFGDGFWLGRQETNRHATLRHGFAQLEHSGNFQNLRLAAGTVTGEYRRPQFMDSDVYKWLEAVGFDLANERDPELEQMAETAIDLLEAAQTPEGYLNSYWQVVEPERRWADIDHGHELYCAGHLFQAAVAYHRATGDTRLLGIATRFADYIDSVFGPGKRPATPGHPEVEMALIELYRDTGERRYLELAAFFLGQRGTGKLRGLGKARAEYHQDRVSVRETSVVEGHAVRQLYLTSGVTDLYLETGEQALYDALMRQYHDFVATKLHITGGAGARHEGESFGESYELPNDRCYCETCAQIASMMWNWRLLLATGEGRYADLFEQTLYNGFLSGISLQGSRYFYENPLLSRGSIQRPEWYGCACCPPNVMRTLASLQHYFTTVSASGVQIHQYAPLTLAAELPGGGRVALRVESGYPWDGKVRVTVEDAPAAAWGLSLRIPGWCTEPVVRVNGAPSTVTPEHGYYTVVREWQTGDVVELELAMPPVLMEAHPRVDPTRGSLAIQRGPMVYCLEEVDQEAGIDLFDVQIDPSAPLSVKWQDDLLDGVTVIEAGGCVADVSGWGEHLYRPLGSVKAPSRSITLTAIPYYAWANRGPGSMRVWIARAN